MDKQHTVSFRLATHDFANLTERAAAAGLSPGAFARVFVLDLLNRPHGAGGLEADELQQLFETHLAGVVTKHDLATAVSALLVAAGIDQDRAQTWVKTNLLASGGTP